MDMIMCDSKLERVGRKERKLAVGPSGKDAKVVTFESASMIFCHLHLSSIISPVISI